MTCIHLPRPKIQSSYTKILASTLVIAASHRTWQRPLAMLINDIDSLTLLESRVVAHEFN